MGPTDIWLLIAGEVASGNAVCDLTDDRHSIFGP